MVSVRLTVFSVVLESFWIGFVGGLELCEVCTCNFPEKILTCSDNIDFETANSGGLVSNSFFTTLEYKPKDCIANNINAKLYNNPKRYILSISKFISSCCNFINPDNAISQCSTNNPEPTNNNNPETQKTSTAMQTSLTIGLAIFFPLIFVFYCVLCIFYVKSKTNEPNPTAPSTPYFINLDNLPLPPSPIDLIPRNLTDDELLFFRNIV